MQTVTLARHAMATRFELVLHGDDAIALRAAGEEALNEIDRLENQLSLYRPGSEIAQLNARAAREAVRVTPELFTQLQHAQQLHVETQGAFDITIAPLVRCWGFMGGTGKMPTAEQVAEARAKIVPKRPSTRKIARCASRAKGDARLGALAKNMPPSDTRSAGDKVLAAAQSRQRAPSLQSAVPGGDYRAGLPPAPRCAFAGRSVRATC
jgi:thiamine biosynthesis lipoprotein ApbE